MSNRKPSRNFTNPCRTSIQAPVESSFEQVVQSLRLAPEEYAGSVELKAWVIQNMHSRYVPSDLLAVFGFEEVAEA
jgi:hypothetical protein